VAIGVINLIFAMACGCVSAIWAMSWREIHDEPEMAAVGVERTREQMRGMVEQMLRSRPDAQSTDEKTAKVVADAATQAPIVTATLTAVADHPQTPAIRTTTMVAGFAQAALLVGSILLLKRRNMGRVLSMLALLAFIGATVATFYKFPPVAKDSGRALAAKVTETNEFQALPTAAQDEARHHLDYLTVLSQGTVFLCSVGAVIWPFISLMILFFSRSIRESCRPTYGPP
jgi:hypothetical protein